MEALELGGGRREGWLASEVAGARGSQAQKESGRRM